MPKNFNASCFTTVCMTVKEAMPEMKQDQSSKKSAPSLINRTGLDSVINRLADIRKKQGLSQSKLAAQAGITRQAIYAIEADQYLPSTQISLQLAEVLGCHVEDLFSLQERTDVIDAELIGQVTPPKKPMRVKLSQVGSRMFARPMAELGEILNFVMPADGIILEHSKSKPRKKKSACTREVVASTGND